MLEIRKTTGTSGKAAEHSLGNKVGLSELPVRYTTMPTDL
jgi:hypothetical protein